MILKKSNVVPFYYVVISLLFFQECPWWLSFKRDSVFLLTPTRFCTFNKRRCVRRVVLVTAAASPSPPPTGVVKFIDYEYAGYNYQAFDIGNHFNEFAGRCALRVQEVQFARKHISWPEQMKLPWRSGCCLYSICDVQNRCSVCAVSLAMISFELSANTSREIMSFFWYRVTLSIGGASCSAACQSVGCCALRKITWSWAKMFLFKNRNTLSTKCLSFLSSDPQCVLLLILCHMQSRLKQQGYLWLK